MADALRRLFRPPLQPAHADHLGNVKNLALAWIYRASAQAVANSGGEYRPGDPSAGAAPARRSTIKATPLMVDGVLYLAAPDHAYAVDARTGKEIWHYFWRTRGGIHIGNRGVGMRGNAVFFETPDCYLVSLDATTGKERWHKEIADVRQQYFSHAGADRDRQPRDRRRRRRLARRAGVSRVARSRTPAICNGAGTPRRRRRASRGRRRGRTSTR